MLENIQGDEQLRAIRRTGAAIGIALILGGVALAGFLFVQIVRSLDNPNRFKGSLDKWETVIRGSLTIPSVPVEESVGDVRPSRRSPSFDQLTIAKPFSEAIVVGSRLLAAVFMTLFALVLAVMSLSLIGAGGRLVSLATSEAEVMRKLLMYLYRNPPPNRGPEGL